MKLKNIIFTVLTAAVAAGTSSCEDMLKVDSRVVLYEHQNTLDHATDTVYSVMGIISKLQAIADRSILLNEVRGDLVQTTPNTKKDNPSLQKIYEWDFSGSDNVYDDPTDYYAVINNCNYFLAHADTSYVRNHKNVFLKEYIAVLSYRAWTYLQLAQAYGKVYYVNEPIVSADQADAGRLPLLDIKQLADTLIYDFEERFLDYDIPNYGNLAGGTNGDGSTSESHATEDIIIPTRVILGDLNLWAGHYADAARYYAEYLTDINDPRSTGTASILWFDAGFTYLGDDNYSGQFGKNMKPICYIPMEADVYGGTVSDLPNIFNSTEKNGYWHQLKGSNSLYQLSAAQNYCFFSKNLSTGYTTPKYLADKRNEPNLLLRGDLRVHSILTSSTAKKDEVGINLNKDRQTLAKINAEKVSIYRNDVIYLRLAEALNRCGLYRTAFAILKYGLNSDNMSGISYQTSKRLDMDYPSDSVKAKSLGLGDLYTAEMFNRSSFNSSYLTGASTTWTFSGRNRTSGAGVKFTADYFTYSEPETQNTVGIHSRGCGCSEIDTTYVIGFDKTIPCSSYLDTIRYVEQKILDEMALETCFEGYRFGDLLRISMHRAGDVGYDGYGGFADNAFLAGKVSKREGDTSAEQAALYAKLLGDGKSLNENWFLTLEKQINKQ